MNNSSSLCKLDGTLTGWLQNGHAFMQVVGSSQLGGGTFSRPDVIIRHVKIRVRTSMQTFFIIYYAKCMQESGFAVF